MKRYKIHTTQSLDANGKIGVWLFLLSPIVGGGCYYWFLVESLRRYAGTPALPALLMIAAGLAFFGGAVMILLGRTFSHTMQEVAPAEKQQSEGLWMQSIDP